MKILKGILLFILLSILLISGYIIFTLSPTSISSEEEIRFIVATDEPQKSVVKRLKDDNLIRCENCFTTLAGWIHFPGTVEPGGYNLKKNLWVWQTAKILLSDPYQKWITFVPGLRKEQVAERLAKKFNWSISKSSEFLTEAKEGYLYPDTYLLNVDYSGKEFANRLMNTFNEHIPPEWLKELTRQNVRLDTAVKMASLIERESGSDEDKAIIAAVIWNRVDKDMRLQLDATNQYIIGTPETWWPHVTPEHLKIESPYNLYLHKGLPPTPIASPSFASLKAVIYPAQTDCLYYLHDRGKQIHCSETYEGHKENIEQYLQ